MNQQQRVKQDAQPDLTKFTIADVKANFEMVAHWRTFDKYFHPQWGYFAVSETRNVLLGPCHDARAIDGAIAGFHETKHSHPNFRNWEKS